MFEKQKENSTKLVKRENGRKGLHAYTHPKTAYENAKKVFNVNEKDVLGNILE